MLKKQILNDNICQKYRIQYIFFDIFKNRKFTKKYIIFSLHSNNKMILNEKKVLNHGHG